jgi:C4-dicarboxylate transporter/malic acid transport protein
LPRLPIRKAAREAVRHLTPNWFAATMGTGVLALVLHQAAPNDRGTALVAGGLWAADLGLFVLLSVLHLGRWILFPAESRRMLEDPVMPMFLGCIPMGLATIINGALVFLLPRAAPAAVQIVEALWWADAAMAAAIGVAAPFLMFTRQSHRLEQMSAVWLLPIVAAEVAGVSGGLVTPHLAGANHQLLVLAASYVLWACSVPMALGILTILVLRLAVHKLPHASMAASTWLALGPIGTGALGLLVLGGAAPDVFAANGLAAFGGAASGAGLVGGLALWGYGAWWAAMALLITLRYLRTGFEFNLGWWGYTFPLGVFTLATLKLSTILPLPVFRVLGVLFAVALALVWASVAARSLALVWRSFAAAIREADDPAADGLRRFQT